MVKEKRPDVRSAAHEDKIEHAKGENRLVGLRDIGQGLSRPPATKPPEVAAAHQNAPGGRWHQTGQTLDQRGFSHTVGPQDAHDAAFPDLEGQLIENQAVASTISKRQVFYGQHHDDHPRLLFRSTRANTGAPTVAVSIPSGISAEVIVRAKSSINSK